jgi:hypothetical protein
MILKPDAICICGHKKSFHSLLNHDCMKPLEIICKQDGTWEARYCTCMKYKVNKLGKGWVKVGRK